MDLMPIATRYASLLKEIIEVAKQYQRQLDGSAPAYDFQILDRRAKDGGVEESADFSISLNTRQSSSRPPRIEEHEHRNDAITASSQLQTTGQTRNDLLTSLMNPNASEFGTGEEDLMFESLGGWNVAGNLCSDFYFNGGENLDAALWDWSGRQ